MESNRPTPHEVLSGATRSRFANGLRIVSESLPDLRSVSLGFWVGAGARDEAPALAGVSHFLEHLLFKGTPDRRALEIAEAVESVGGEMNAFTAHEYTVFYVRVPDHDLPLAVDILCDVVWDPAFRPDEVESERGVILDELRMREDAPDDLVHDMFVSMLFPDHPLGREVIGGADTVRSITRDEVVAFHRDHYWPGNIVVSAAGRLDHDDLVARLAGRMPTTSDPGIPGRPTSEPGAPEAVRVIHRSTDMAHVVLGLRALRWDDPDRYALAVLNEALGGGVSSRLFQEVREQRGLAYSVYSYRTAFSETGLFGIYAGTAPGNLPSTLDVIRNELDRLVREEGVATRELERSKGALIGSLALGLESSMSRMHRIGRSELTVGDVPSIDAVAAAIEAIAPDDIARVVDRMFAGAPRSLAVIGPVDERELLHEAG